MSVDAWSYESWGDSLLRGDAPLYDHSRTTPKPLGTALGAAVGLLPPDRGMLLPIVAGVGLLAASIFIAAYRRGGPVAAVVAIGALAIAAPVGHVVRSALIDGVTAGLVALAVALGGWGSVAALLLAGLIRPEAWPLVGLAVFLATRGRTSLRVAAGVLAALAPVALWAAVDYAFTGDALASKDVGERLARFPRPWSDVPGWMLSGLGAKTLVVLALGAIGLAVYARRGRRLSDPAVLLAALALLMWSALVAYEAHQGFNQRALTRYFLPVTGLMALGCGLLAASIAGRWGRPRGVWVAAAVSAVPLALVIVQMSVRLEVRDNQIQAVQKAVPAIQRVLPCGRVGIAGSERGVAYLPHIALLSGRPVSDFEFVVPGRSYGAVLRVTLVAHRPGLRRAQLPDWPRVETPIGPLAIAPGCAVGLP